MTNTSRIVVSLSLICAAGGMALAAGHHHNHRTHRHHPHWRHRHAWHHVKGAAVAARESSTDRLYWPDAEYLQDWSRDWWTMSSGLGWLSTSTRVEVNHDNTSNLNEFGTGRNPLADLVRFTRPSMVVDYAEASLRGLSGGVRHNWSPADQLKEGQFIADYQSMLLHSFGDNK